METVDREMILSVIKTNGQLRRLYAEHEQLEDRLGALERRRFLTSREEVEAKRLKLMKLKGVDKMMEILAESRPQL